MSDLKHNMQIDRIPNPTENDYKRLKKYKKAYKYLLEYDRTIDRYNKIGIWLISIISFKLRW